MKKTKTYILFILILTLISCSSIKFSENRYWDTVLIEGDKLDGTFSKTDVYNNKKKIKKDLYIKQIDDKHIALKVYKNDSLISDKILEGKFRNGYFKVKKKWKSDFSAVVLWTFGNNTEYFGRTESNDLIIMESRFSVMVFGIIPVMVDGKNFETEYTRIE